MQKEYIQTQDYCLSVRDGTHDTPKPVAIGKPLVTSKAINNNNIDFSVTYNISEKDFNKINKRSLVEKWDLLMTMIGTVGRLHIVKNCPDYAIKNIALFKIKDEQKAKWLYYYLSLKEVQTYFQSIANGTSQHFIPLNVLRKLKIENYNVHSPRIINILSTYDDLIEKNNRKIAILQEMAEELYKEWFVRFRFPGYKTAKFKDGIPEGWAIKKLGNICQMITGNKDANQATGNGTYPFFTCARETTLTTDEFILDTDAILISGNGSYTGFVKKFSGKFDLYQRTYALYNFKDVDWLYVYWVMKTDFEPKHMGGTNGAAIPYITKPVLEKYKLLVPSKELLSKAGKIFLSFHKQCDLLAKQNYNLTQQRDLLLPRLMSGKLEVKA